MTVTYYKRDVCKGGDTSMGMNEQGWNIPALIVYGLFRVRALTNEILRPAETTAWPV